MNISTSPQILSLANSLGLLKGDPVESIRQYCLDKVRRFLALNRKPLSMESLEEVICNKLRLRVHRVWSDQEIEHLIDRYIAQGEILFAALKQQLSPDAFGIFIRLSKPDKDGTPWVAVIDCRGEKQHKRHWTFWHEVSHCLTAVDEMQLPLRRTTIDNAKKEPIEILTDYIAKELAFYGPIFDPILARELEQSSGLVSFALVERVREQFCPDCSFSSTLSACIERSPKPYLLLEVATGFSKRELAAIKAGNTQTEASLRVRSVHPNEAMKKRNIFIPANYRVPTTSAIYLTYQRPRTAPLRGIRNVENLSDWSDSNGRTLSPIAISVEARKFGDCAIAIIGLCS